MRLIQSVSRSESDIEKWISDCCVVEESVLKMLSLSFDSGEGTRLLAHCEMFDGNRVEISKKLHSLSKEWHTSYGNKVFHIAAYYGDEIIPRREICLVVMNDGDVSYELKMKQEVVLGERRLLSISSTSPVDFRPNRLQCNAPCMGFIEIIDFKIANCGLKLGPKNIEIDSVSNSVSGYWIDAIHYHNERQFGCLEIKADNCTMTALAEYSGLVPEGYHKGDVFDFELSLRGTTHD